MHWCLVVLHLKLKLLKILIKWFLRGNTQSLPMPQSMPDILWKVVSKFNQQWVILTLICSCSFTFVSKSWFIIIIIVVAFLQTPKSTLEIAVFRHKIHHRLLRIWELFRSYSLSVACQWPCSCNIVRLTMMLYYKRSCYFYPK